MRSCLLVAALLALSIGASAKKYAYANREEYAKINEFEVRARAGGASGDHSNAAEGAVGRYQADGGEVQQPVSRWWQVPRAPPPVAGATPCRTPSQQQQQQAAPPIA